VADAYRIAFDEQLSANRSLVGQLVKLYSPRNGHLLRKKGAYRQKCCNTLLPVISAVALAPLLSQLRPFSSLAFNCNKDSKICVTCSEACSISFNRTLLIWRHGDLADY